jgi:hypothetical protein
MNMQGLQGSAQQGFQGNMQQGGNWQTGQSESDLSSGGAWQGGAGDRDVTAAPQRDFTSTSTERQGNQSINTADRTGRA